MQISSKSVTLKYEAMSPLYTLWLNLRDYTDLFCIDTHMCKMSKIKGIRKKKYVYQTRNR